MSYMMFGGNKVATNSIRTTLALPGDILDAVDQMVRQGEAHSRNEFVAYALRRELARLERIAIDEAFAGMATDIEYQEEARQIADEFAIADWEAFQSAEGK